MFPATLTKCQLHELYYDENPLLQRLPVKSQHADDIFYLKVDREKERDRQRDFLACSFFFLR